MLTVSQLSKSFADRALVDDVFSRSIAERIGCGPGTIQSWRFPANKRGELDGVDATTYFETRSLPAFIRSALLAIRITFNRCVFALSTRESVENLTMPLQTVLIIAGLVLLDPLNQLSQHGRLILWRGKFFGFPRPTMAMSHTDLNPRIQKSQLRAVRKRGLDQITVTTLYNPSLVALDEIVKQTQAHLQRLPFRTMIPGDFI
jgi:hypothetical protein